MDFLKLVGTALLSVVALFVITKIMGHKQVAQLDFFDYVSGITIGSIGAELATDLEAPWKSLVALVIYGGVSVLLNFLTHRCPRTRKYINGTPSILFENGNLYRENLKKAKLDLSEFMLLCREQGYFDLDDIETAVFEANGQLSILPKMSVHPLTPRDIGLTVEKKFIGVEVVMDGRVMGENLSWLGRDERWLCRQLAMMGIRNVKDVLLGIYHPQSDTIKCYPKKTAK